jgi:hypothetical protein
VTAAKRALPKTLAAASRQLRARADGRPVVQLIVDALYEKGALTNGELDAAIGRTPSGHLQHAFAQRLITKTPIRQGRRTLFRYSLTPAGIQRATGDGDGSDAPPTRQAKTRPAKPPRRVSARATRQASAKARANDPPTALRGKKLSAFLLTTISDAPQTSPDLVAALQAVGHPIKQGNGIAGPLAKITAAGWLRRNPKGVYTITPKGRRRLPLNGATSNGTQGDDATAPA